MENGVLYFTERIKDLFKTANGKYIAPQMLEGLLTVDPLFEQVAIIADGYKFVSALIYPIGKCCAVRLPSVVCLVTSVKRSSASSMRCTAS